MDIKILLKNLVQELYNKIPKQFSSPDGLEIITKNLKQTNINIISGYPISINELSIMKENGKIIGSIFITIDNKLIINRFFNRAECPICQLPGILGQSCKTHNVKMLKRSDCTISDLNNRTLLFNTRIMPFYQQYINSTYPNIQIDSKLCQKIIIEKIISWIKKN